MNVYQVITDRILQALAEGVVPWRKPWRTTAPMNLVSRKEYRGINVIMLQATRYESPWWLTFNQARALKGTVCKGERGTPIVFWKRQEERDERGEPEERFVLRYFTVFNIEQCAGIKPPPVAPRPAFDPIAACERIVTGFEGRPRIEHGGAVACYIPAIDEVRMPARESFTSSPEYYSCLFHELVHSTGAQHRLARAGILDRTGFGSHAYSFEELVAECGSAFLCAEAGIVNATLDNSAAYIASWSKALKREPTWLVRAAGHAAKAADLVLGRQRAQANAEAA
jgi:antirestriction protein ArdC